MARELANLLLKEHCGVVERHAVGRRPFSIKFPIKLSPSRRQGSGLSLSVSSEPKRRPVSTTVLRFMDAGKAQLVLGEAFRDIRRRGLNAEVYIPKVGNNPHKIVLNIFDQELAAQWSRVIGRPLQLSLLSPMLRKRVPIKKVR